MKIVFLFVLVLCLNKLVAQVPFITTWRTDLIGTSNNSSITIPTEGVGYNYDVDWENDGSFDTTGITGNITHQYDTAGIYQVGIRGIFPRIYFNNGLDKNKILSIDQWGDIEWQSMEFAFYGCLNLTYSATDNPDLSNVTSLHSMFRQAKIFNGNLNTWDVDSIIDMSYMFYEAHDFNGDIDAWNVGSVTDMSYMFYRDFDFSGDLGSWDVSSVLNMKYMFAITDFFNGSIESWEVDSVTDMAGMFLACDLINRDLNGWNVSSVTDMSFMFSDAKLFNQDLNSWDVSSVTDMNSMFLDANDFNGNISNWNVSSVTDMSSMFWYDYPFNQNVSNWDVSSVKYMPNMFFDADFFNGDLSIWEVDSVLDMSAMFSGADHFSGDLSGWNVSSVTNMRFMFADAELFNAELNGWNVSSVTDMAGMFTGANSFNHDISNWDVSSVTDMSFIFSYRDSFNFDLSMWDVGSVAKMRGMFVNTPLFDQKLGMWDISSVEKNSNGMKDMLSNTGMSTSNFDSTLIGWLNQGVDSLTLGALGLTFCHGKDAHDALTMTHGWTITGDALSCTLPVELLYFTAYLNPNKSVFLTWSTASEIANDGFEIQRSNNGVSWHSLDFIDGHGSTSEHHKYEYLDTPLHQGKVYYRLKQVDLKGQFRYSQIRSVDLDILDLSIAEVYPNPFVDFITIDGAVNESTYLYIYTIDGQLLRTHSLSNGYTVNLTNVPKGIIVLKLYSENQNDYRQFKLVKN